MFFKNKFKFLWFLLVYLSLRCWDLLLSYVAYTHDPGLFISGEQNRALVEFFVTGKATTLSHYEVVGFFVFFLIVILAQLLWKRGFRLLPFFVIFLPLSISFIAPLTWFWPGPELAFYFSKITWGKAALLIALVALLDFCRWLIKCHFFIFVKVLN